MIKENPITSESATFVFRRPYTVAQSACCTHQPVPDILRLALVCVALPRRQRHLRWPRAILSQRQTAARCSRLPGAWSAGTESRDSQCAMRCCHVTMSTTASPRKRAASSFNCSMASLVLAVSVVVFSRGHALKLGELKHPRLNSSSDQFENL